MYDLCVSYDVCSQFNQNLLGGTVDGTAFANLTALTQLYVLGLVCVELCVCVSRLCVCRVVCVVCALVACVLLSLTSKGA